MQDLNNPVFYTEYPGAAGFAEVFERDLKQWLADEARPWAAERAAQVAAGRAAVAVALPTEFDAEGYQAALRKRFDKLNFDMLDTTGASYSGIRLWSVFVPQSVRECHQYNPRLLEIPKEHQQRLLKAGEIAAADLEEAERQADRLRQEYFSQPLRPVLDVIDETLGARSARAGQTLVILGDPGSGKSSLIRYLALRWARIAEPTVRDTQPIPLVIDLREYGRWQCEGRKGFVRFLEEAPVWHDWSRGLLDRLIGQPGLAVLLLDGLDEIFDPQTARCGHQRHPALQQRVRPHADSGDVARRGLSAAAAARHRVPSLHVAGPGRRSDRRLRRPLACGDLRQRGAGDAETRSFAEGHPRFRSRSPCWQAIRYCSR